MNNAVLDTFEIAHVVLFLLSYLLHGAYTFSSNILLYSLYLNKKL